MRTSAATTRRAAWMAVAIAVVLSLAPGPAAATPAVNEAGDAVRPVTIVPVRDLTWRTAPSSLDGFAKASVSMRSAPPRSHAEDTYMTLGEANRAAFLPDDAGVGRVHATSDGGLRLPDWQKLEHGDAGLPFRGPLDRSARPWGTSGRRWAVASDDNGASAVAANGVGVVPCPIRERPTASGAPPCPARRDRRRHPPPQAFRQPSTCATSPARSS